MSTHPLPYFVDFSALYRRADAISHAHQSGNLVFFLGAGASKAFHPDFPSWPQLLDEVLADTEVEKSDRKEIQKLLGEGRYLLAAEALKRFAEVDRVDRDEAMDRKIAKILERRPIEEGKPHLHSAVLDFAVPVVTTNYDKILEEVLRQHNLDRTVPVFTHENAQQIALCLNPTELRSRYVFKLHGGAGDGRLILDEGDYTELYFRESWPLALALLRRLLATKMVVFVGFSLSDPEIMPLLREATRHSSSYQHLAFFQGDDVSKIQRQVLREHYRVDPILYQDHDELPLYILEMRNFHPRDQLTLSLRDKRSALEDSAASIRQAESLSSDTAVVLFGSYAKYGDWVPADADVDMLFLSPVSTVSSEAQGFSVLDRRVDATILSRTEFEELLLQGDAFASSILATGCPIVDPKGIYGLLARGFSPRYTKGALTDNAYRRCRLRWLRLCALRSAARIDFLRACQQWALTLMQLALVQREPPKTLLDASLLGNARYTIHEFAQSFDSADEAFFLDLLRGAKGLEVSRPGEWPDLAGLVAAFRSALGKKITPYEKDLLEPSGKLSKADPDRIARMYSLIKSLLGDTTNLGNQISLPGEPENELFNRLSDPGRSGEMSTFDWLFFFDLFERDRVPGGSEALTGLVADLQARWKGPGRSSRRPGAKSSTK